MRQLTMSQRVFIKNKYESTKSPAEVIRLFGIEYPDRPPLSTATIWKINKKFNENGTILNLNKGKSGRRRTGRSEENINAVREAVENNPSTVSCRKNGLGLNYVTFHRIIKLDLNWYPYRIVVRHQLKETDHGRRLTFCRWFLQQHNNRRFLVNLIIGDEAGFHMNGTVNTQNVRCYAPRGNPPPDFVYDVNENREKVTVWAGMIGNGTIIGPYFFDGNVNSDSYLELLNEFVLPQLLLQFRNQFRDGRFLRLWWAQDGARPHCSVQCSEWITEFFGPKVIALNHPVEWPPRSPDLTPCDFFLWGYLKDKVYVTPPASIAELRDRITREFDVLKRNIQLIRSAMWAMVNRVEVCIERNGGHVEGKFR